VERLIWGAKIIQEYPFALKSTLSFTVFKEQQCPKPLEQSQGVDMKTFLIVAAAVAVLGAFAVSLHQAVAQQSGPVSSKQESPFACRRMALSLEQRQRKDELARMLHPMMRTPHELADGFEFEFPSDAATFQKTAEWAAMERVCCPFFDFDLRLEREGGKFWLRLTGREGVKRFIQSEFQF